MKIEFVVHVPAHAADRFRQACRSHSAWKLVAERPVEEDPYDDMPPYASLWQDPESPDFTK